MDNTSIESLRIVRNTNQDMLNYFNDSYITRLEQVQSLKSEEFELKAKIDELQKTLDVYSFKTSTGHNVFSPFAANTTSQQEKASQIELQLKEMQDVRSSLLDRIRKQEEETDLLKKRISSLSNSNHHLDELLSEITDEISAINESHDSENPDDEASQTPVNHGLNILRLQQYEKQQLAEKIEADITDVLDANSHKLEVLSWLIRTDINRAKVTLEELTSSTSKLADYVDELANNLADPTDADKPLWMLLEKLMQDYNDDHPECNISSDIDCKDYTIYIPDIVTTNTIYIVEELMSNVFRHSGANKVVFKAYISGRLVDVSIKDNGVGIDSSSIDTSPWYSGLHRIKEIIYLLGGTFKIDGDIENGTNVRFSFSLEQTTN